VRWLGICDGNMEEGSLRCDANVSIRPNGDTKLGTKVEIKNINSIRFVRKAIESEIARQIALTKKGEKIIQQTRGYDSDHDTTHAQRDKEEAHDYRYFPCPDLPPFTVTDAKLNEIKANMPVLPAETEAAFTAAGLPLQDAQVLAEEKHLADYMQLLMEQTAEVKAAANWLLGPVKKWLNEQNKEITEFPLPPAQLGKLVEFVSSGKVNFSTAATRILPMMIENPLEEPIDIATSLGCLQEENEEMLEQWVRAVIVAMPDKVKEYQKGKKGLIGLFVGEVKKRSKGKADPQKATHLLQTLLDESS
jgi:aspartyl-tRNA(Asn)/glutamyl-tRNA(Gln) amidotransferase subunit B